VAVGAPAAEAAPAPYLDEVHPDASVVERSAIPYARAEDAAGVEQTLLLDLFDVPSDPTPRRPVVVLLSGGGFTGDNRNSALLVRWARAMARRGFVVATIDYRTADDESPLALFASVERAIEDLRAAARWLRANQATAGHADDFPLAGPDEDVDLRIDPARVVAGGYSAGAVTALSAGAREVLHPGHRDPAAPDFQPIVNPTNPSWPDDLAAVVSAAGAELGGPDAGDPPMLMFHGDGDTRVAYDGDTGEDYGIGFSGVASCERGRAAGRDCIFHTFPGVAHGLFDNGPREQGMHQAMAQFLSCRVGAPVPFPDVGRWAELAAGWASRSGVVEGFADGTFRGRDRLRRGQLIAMLWRLVDRPAVSGPDPFPDVPAWLSGAARWAADAGVVTGWDGRLRPRAVVTRAQAARMLHRAAGDAPTDDLPAHGLTDVPRWVEGDVRWLVAPRSAQLLGGAGLATGYADRTFRPALPVTRNVAVRWLHALALAGDAWDPDRQVAPVTAACYRLDDP